MKIKYLDGILNHSFYLLFFLVPLAMSPWNYELFEFNKMVLVYLFTAVILGVWVGKMVISKKFIFKKTPFDIPLLIFFVSQFLSFLFSIDHYTSFWGYYSRFHGGLLSLICYFILCFALASNFDKQKVIACLKYLLAGTVIVSLFGISEHFGVDAKYWVQDVKSRVFSSLGQPNWLAAYLAALLPISIVFLPKDTKNKKLLIYYSLALLLALICLIFTKSRSGIPAAAVGLGLFFFFLSLPKLSFLKKQYQHLITILFLLVLTASLFFGSKTLFPNLEKDLLYIFGFTNEVNIETQLPYAPGSSSGDIRKVVWRGSVDIFKHYPIFGSGLETFVYSYYKYKPVQHNVLSEWDFLYNKAHNEYFNYLATTGAIGTISYLLFISWVIWWWLKEIKNSKNKGLGQLGQLEIKNLLLAFFAGWISILVSNFFGFSVVIIAVFFFLFPLMSFLIIQEEIEQPKPVFKNQVAANNEVKLNKIQSLSLVAILLIFLFVIYKISLYWLADVDYAAGNKFNKQGLYQDAFVVLQKAIEKNGIEPMYKDELAWSSVNLAIASLASKDSNKAVSFADYALSLSDDVLKSYPDNLNYVRTRAKIMFTLAQVDGRFISQGINVLLKANELAPTDAKFLYNLGLANLSLNEKDKALSYFQKAIEVKPNYLEASLTLAKFYTDNNQTEKAIETYEYIINNKLGNPRYELALLYEKTGNIKKAKQQLEEAMKVGHTDEVEKKYEEIKTMSN